jgi:hypothetical protein
MANDILAYGRGTHGSYTVLIHGHALRTRAFAPLRRYTTDAFQQFDVGDRRYFAPVQSAGESQQSLRIENYLGSALAGYDHLVSDSRKEMRMTASPAARASSMDPWKVKNQRRIRLIEMKHANALSAKERAELATLEAQFSSHLRQVAPRSREILDEFADYVSKMKAKVAAKKGIKP